jgi:hypothetical protein
MRLEINENIELRSCGCLNPSSSSDLTHFAVIKELTGSGNSHGSHRSINCTQHLETGREIGNGLNPRDSFSSHQQLLDIINKCRGDLDIPLLIE